MSDASKTPLRELEEEDGKNNDNNKCELMNAN